MTLPTHCQACEGKAAALDDKTIKDLLEQLPGWQVIHDKVIEKSFTFKNYKQTIAFVNAIAWFTEQEKHHPDLTVGYNRCVVQYTTHAIDGLSFNDFICAHKIEALLDTRTS